MGTLSSALSTPRAAWALCFGLIILDQLSKTLILAILSERFPPTLEVTSFFNLVLVWNHGVSFGLFSDANARWFLVIFKIIVSVVLIIWARKAETPLERCALLVIVAGAVGNAIDRVLYGAVFDFLDFHFFGWHFWAFNVADSAITLGVILLLLDTLFPRPKHDTYKV